MMEMGEKVVCTLWSRTCIQVYKEKESVAARTMSVNCGLRESEKETRIGEESQHPLYAANRIISGIKVAVRGVGDAAPRMDPRAGLRLRALGVGRNSCSTSRCALGSRSSQLSGDPCTQALLHQPRRPRREEAHARTPKSIACGQIDPSCRALRHTTAILSGEHHNGPLPRCKHSGNVSPAQDWPTR